MYAQGKAFPLDGQRAVGVYLHAGSPLTVMQGTSARFDLTRFVRSCRQGPSEATLGLSWHDELYGDNQPRAGLIVELVIDGDSYWLGIIQAVNDFRLSSGERSMSIVARSRDATPAFRDTRRTTDIYPTATPLSYIARQVAQATGLSAAEINLQETGTATVHSNTQLADLTPWQMLTQLHQAAGLEPYVDCRGALKLISRDLARQPDIVLDDNRRVLSVGGSKSLPALTELRVKWLDPNLTESTQQNRMLDRASITAGFFQLKQEYNVRFSPDSTQRARATHMVIRQSANSGLLPVASETYTQTSPTGGKITLKTSAWVPLLTTGAMVAKFVAHNTPDIAPPTGGPTVPVGRRLEYAADAVLFLTMMSVGTGQYEIWGTPYDYVHARNTTTAYNSSAQPWEIKPEEVENDFVVNEPQAQAFAIRELIYRSRAAMTFNVEMVDDTRVERGDLIELADGSRIYVTDYSRDLSHGSPAVLSVSGFMASGHEAGDSINVGAAETAPPIPMGDVSTFEPPPPLPLPLGVFTPPVLGTIYIPAPPVTVSNMWTMRFVGHGQSYNNGHIHIANWHMPATTVEAMYTATARRPPRPGEGELYYYLEGGVYRKQYFKDEPPEVTGSPSSSASALGTDNSYAFDHVGTWAAGGNPSDSYLAWWAFSVSDGLGGMVPAASCDPHYSIATGKLFDAEIGPVGPVNWNIEAWVLNEEGTATSSKVVHVVREELPWGPLQTREFNVKHAGLNFYRLHITQNRRRADVPQHPELCPTEITRVELLAGALDLCSVGGEARGFGDSSSVGTSRQSGDMAFAPNSGGWKDSHQYTMLPSWLRYGFNESTQVTSYAITAASRWNAPFDWTFEVSVNGVDWHIVDTREGVRFEDGERKVFDLADLIVFGDPP